MTDKELKDLVAGLAISNDRIQKMQEENAQAQKKTDEQMRRNEAKLTKLGVLAGNISANNGSVAEEFFYSSLKKNKKLGNIIYDEIGREWKKNIKNLRGEYDIVLVNGNEIALVEVKYKIHQNDVEKMKKKIKDFPLLFPDYAKFKIRGAFASLSMSDKAETEILEHGYFALKQEGNHLEISSPVIFS